MYEYLIGQFRVRSDFVLPCDPGVVAVHDDTEIDLAVRRAMQPLDEFSQAFYIDRRHGGLVRAYATEEGILLCLGHFIKIHICREGNGMDVFAVDEYQNLAAAAVVNAGVSICTLLHNAIPLHAAGIELDGKFIGIMAPSGTGKSTLSWSLLKNGAFYGNDDVIPVRCSDEAVTAHPFVGLFFKSDRTVRNNENIAPADCIEIHQYTEEIWLPVPAERRVCGPRPLHALFVLDPVEDSGALRQSVSIERKEGSSALSLLLGNIQALWVVYHLLDKQRLFSQLTTLAGSVPVFTVHYERNLSVLPSIEDRMRKLLAASV